MALAERHQVLEGYRDRIRRVEQRLGQRRSALVGQRGELREVRD
ncbi:hypothetical protein [Streptomyces millisiae]|uniref:Uncharacterized protein n=1 Tax=Streptomyces millisiae TaxID=3075542 RepID=A0ABU2LP02_9ACTN|nr:hypothetical protein [Streptomyces sp. DSM 44918]MDT0319311.1 hypothetical protein [Streptomyces sp. DSM 44918]